MMTFTEWKASREASVKEPQGDLALVAMHEIKVEQHVAGIPGTWMPTYEQEPGLTLKADATDELRLDNGSVVSGTVQLIADETVIQINKNISATATYQPGSLHLLAIWDANSEAIKQFKGIDVYPYNPDWVIEAKFIADQEIGTFDFVHTGDQDRKARTHQSLGEIHFQHEGISYAMRPFASGESMIIVFRDASSGVDTYDMGRMLLVSKPASDGKVVLDFNRAFLPPCAFSMHFNCPMPPASNRIPAFVTAGEKCVKRDDFVRDHDK